MHHLEASLEQTPITYIQNRFRFGKDKETEARFRLTEEEEALMSKRGAINGVVDRKLQVPIHIISIIIHRKSWICRIVACCTQGKQVLYAVTKTGRKEDHDVDWEMQVNLELKAPCAHPLPSCVRILSLRQGTLN